ncbi:hypothetical protein EJB05_14695 [Eragrostis curvula]|uniref:Uncharacterized protein n=1 Tax=Eragrostis curvula TaxID=38414 RepID=A0A5J9VZX7_9POAL|nr:hypothetical protein EJB05_14695 [Eragrostis curvula]
MKQFGMGVLTNIDQTKNPDEHEDAMPINELITENGKSGGMQGFVWQVGFEVAITSIMLYNLPIPLIYYLFQSA